MRYKIVLYNAGKRIKCFGAFRKYSEANHIYQLNLSNNIVLFPKLSSWRGSETDFELVLLGPPEGKHIGHTRDELGRKVTLKASGGHTIKKIEPYYIEETFLHKNTNKKMQFREFAKTFLVKNKGVKTFHTVKNKLLIEYLDSDRLDLFILKNHDDAVRLNDTIKDFCYTNEIYDNMYFTQNTIEMRSLLYDMVVERLGLTREYMRREATR